MTTPIICTRGLTRRFGDFTAVAGLDLAIPRGTIFAFLGANGSGKSTTIRMLIGLLCPTEGTIEVDGIDVIRNPRRVRDHIGYMGQKVSLYQGLSLRENVEFYAGLYGLAGRQLEEAWGALRERFALGEAEQEQVEALPAGLRQRAGLALAMLHQPPVLFLDEPTAGVDVRSRALFWEAIQDEAERGVTVFVTTHFLEEVEYCDWVSFIDEGRLVADAAPEDLRCRFSNGYRITVAASPAARAALASTGLEARETAAGLEAVGSTLAPAQLAALGDLARTGVRVRIDQPTMPDVFRRVLESRATVEAAA